MPDTGRRISKIGKEIKRTGARIIEMSGKTAKKMIGKTVFGTKIEHHIVHFDGRETIETIEVMHDLVSGLEDRSSYYLAVLRQGDEPSRSACRIGAWRLSVDLAVSLVGYLGEDFRVIAIKPPIGFFHGAAGKPGPDHIFWGK